MLFRQSPALSAIFRSVFLIILLSTTVCFAQQPSQSARVKFNFNPGWKVKVGEVAGAEAANFNDSDWKDVTTPYAWNESDAFRKAIQDLSTGVAWYRKHFKIPESAAGKKIFLEFEGIRQAGEFYLNGKFKGRHENGVMAFGFDITNDMKQ